MLCQKYTKVDEKGEEKGVWSQKKLLEERIKNILNYLKGKSNNGISIMNKVLHSCTIAHAIDLKEKAKNKREKKETTETT